MSTTAEQLIRRQAPAVTPHPFGLFSVAPPTDPNDRWAAGVAWRSTACSAVEPWGDICITANPVGDKITDLIDCPDDTTAQPFVIYSSGTHSATDPADLERDVRAGLEAGAEYGVEAQVWAFLAAALPTAETATDPVQALAMVEQALGADYHGTGVIHLNRYTATILGADHLHQVGDHLETTIGTPVAVGAGYGDAAPADMTIYGTGAVIVHRQTDVDVFTTVDQATNDTATIAEQTFLAGWDCTTVGATAPIT